MSTPCTLNNSHLVVFVEGRVLDELEQQSPGPLVVRQRGEDGALRVEHARHAGQRQDLAIAGSVSVVKTGKAVMMVKGITLGPRTLHRY